MSRLFNRKATIALWTCVMLGFSALFGSSLSLATSWLLAFVAVMPPMVFLILSPLTLAEIVAKELHPVDKS